MSLYAPGLLETTSGNKLAYSPFTGFHAIWLERGWLSYSNSTDLGGNWGAPVTLHSPGVVNAAIAVANDGTIGVAYVDSDKVYYTAKQKTGAWTKAILIDDGTEVSMVFYGGQMHLGWVSSSQVKYTVVPPLATVPPAQIEAVESGTLCGTWRAKTPSIAVSSRSATDPTPLVRIGFYYTHTPCNNPQDKAGFGYIVSERPATLPVFTWTQIYSSFSSNQIDLSTTAPVSSSITFAPGSGDFLAAFSEVRNGVGTTQLIRQDAWKPQLPWGAVEIIPRFSLVDVVSDISKANCKAYFRIAVAEARGVKYGPTWFRTGTWPSNSATPTWRESAPVMLSTLGRSPQALLFEFSNDFRSTRYLRTFFDDHSGATYDLRLNWYLTPELPFAGNCWHPNTPIHFP